MTKRQKFLVLAIVLLLISAGIVVAGSSTNFTVQRTVVLSGGSAESANFSADVVIGQPVTGSSDSANYQVEAGFFPLPRGGSFEIFLPVVLR
jgi:uncharacterized protein involved in exopolysaccharide biosynthesis